MITLLSLEEAWAKKFGGKLPRQHLQRALKELADRRMGEFAHKVAAHLTPNELFSLVDELSEPPAPVAPTPTVRLKPAK